MTDINELTAKLKAAEETVELQRFKLERQAEDLHQAKSLESIHREKRFEVEQEFRGYKERADSNSMRLAKEVCRLEDEIEDAQSRIAELEARTLTVKLPCPVRVAGGGSSAITPYYDSNGDYYLRSDVEYKLRVAGIKLQIEGE